MDHINGVTKRKLIIHKRIIPFLILFLVILIIVIGESYAYFQTDILGERTYSVAVNNLTLKLDEISTSSDITLTDSTPLTDADGVKQSSYTFTLENQNEFEVGFALFLDDAQIEDEVNRIKDEKIRYQLIIDGKETIGTLSDLGKNPLRLLDIGKMATSQIKEYSLRFWISEEAKDEILGQQLSVKLRVVVTQPEAVDN